jgi:large subunit ribosomal protein L3
VGHKTAEKNGYWAMQVSFGRKPFVREIEVKKGEELKNIGEKLNCADFFVAGDKIAVSGVTKGKGFAGVVKRHHFKGGPKTHGQSDRQRAPGAIGATTTPGRVYKGKRMAGHMGMVQRTVRGLSVFAVKPEENLLLVRGLVPGAKRGLVRIEK